MNAIAYLAIDIQFSRLTELDHQRGLVFLNVYDLPNTNLNTFDGVIISNHIDEPYLLAHDDILTDYINQGGVIFTLVEKSLPWLNCVSSWERSPIPLKDRALEVKATDNGLFENIKVKDLEYRRGVRGFFSRGYFETVPEQAKVLITDQEQKPIVYVDRTHKGTIYAGAGTDMYRIYTYEDNTSNQMGLQMLKAIRTEASRIREDYQH
ncbi:hypothetical protein M4L39_01735 [Staphylococcus equorum]|uniref:Uncharacterized protein n=1 Tax=Staphylococcus equorum TaxID=246432 RepID=A0A9X4L691_9STAP|nr:hypothetical protein [Staphylococcus equorum]MDG0842143.1 hypothetical protein [Staphylococcus equorum]MDG0857806.1 hypothetical protein [Staphylococcus equorum]